MLKRIGFFIILFMAVLYFSGVSMAAPKGAKALFDSGEGPATGISVAPSPRQAESVTVQKQKYVGISYELLLLTDDGQIKKVSKNRVFRSGERIIMRVMTNKSGNLKIYNIGPTGNTNLLFDDFVDAFTAQQIPKGSNFRFVGAPGTETLIVMLSEGATPQVPQGGNVIAGGSQYTPPATQDYSSGGNIQTSSPNMIASNIEGAKKIRGSKDIVVEDKMGSSFAVVSPNNNWKPVQGGAKDIVIESAQGINYGVVPVSALSGGGTLSLTVKLQHR